MQQPPRALQPGELFLFKLRAPRNVDRRRRHLRFRRCAALLSGLGGLSRDERSAVRSGNARPNSVFVWSKHSEHPQQLRVSACADFLHQPPLMLLDKVFGIGEQSLTLRGEMQGMSPPV